MTTKSINSSIDNTESTNDIVLEMVMFEALTQIHKLTGYNKEQMLISLMRIAQDWLTENITFH